MSLYGLMNACWEMLVNVFWMIIARILFFPALLRMALTEKKWYTRIDSTVILGALPLRSQVKKLVENENVRVVISLNEKYELMFFTPSEEEWNKLGVQWFWFSAVDFMYPSMEDIQKCIQIIQDCKRKRETVYVHCKSGKGRSVVVIACYLMKEHDWTPQETTEFIRSKRPQINMNPGQYNMVKTFYDESRKEL